MCSVSFSGLHTEKPGFMRPKPGPESPAVEKLHFNVQPEICGGLSEINIDHSRNSRMCEAVS